MIPDTGRDPDELAAELARLRTGDLPVRGGAVTAYVYDSGLTAVHAAAARAHQDMLEVNALDPTAFPSIVELENQVVGAVAALVGRGAGTPGIATTGGTESIMLAVKAARDLAPRGGAGGRIAAPATAHPAVHKAAHYLGLTVDTVPVDPETFRARAADIERAITDETILVLCSAPSYPQGAVDPVADIAAAAAARGLPCHVDACVGGWLLPWLREAGAAVPPFEMTVPGVTSLSCDLHKFGYTPKGASVVLFATPRQRRAAYFCSASWPGYPVINPTMLSSRSAAPLAAAWTTLQAIGRDGYRQLGRDTLTATRRLRKGIAGVDGLRILGGADTGLIAVAGEDGTDVFTVADEARTRGWFLQPQLSYAGAPATLHITVTAATLAVVEDMLTAIQEATAAARDRGPAPLPEGVVEAVRSLDLEAVGDAEFHQLATAAGVDLSTLSTGGMAGVNTILDALPPAQRETVLRRFLSLLYSGGSDPGQS